MRRKRGPDSGRMSIRYRKLAQVSDHEDTEDDEAELIGTGQFSNISVWWLAYPKMLHHLTACQS